MLFILQSSSNLMQIAGAIPTSQESTVEWTDSGNFHYMTMQSRKN